MRKYHLSNGLEVIEDKKASNSVSIQITVKTGSNYEVDGIRGISHFIEHMLFEGTTHREDAKAISNEIESIGGEINAYTNNVRTGFYVKVPKKYFEKGLDIVSDMVKNPLFRLKDIEKERQVILKEINMFNDDPRFYQWILFQATLYTKHPAKYPAYGKREDVKKIGRKEILSYFNKYYTAKNSILSIVGGVKDSRKLVKKYFLDLSDGKPISNSNLCKEGKLIGKKFVKRRRKIMNSYFVLGHKTVARTHPDSYIFDVVHAILGRGQSGKMFDEIRNKRGLAYEVGVHHESSTDFGFFSVYAGADKSNLKKIEKIIFEVYSWLMSVSDNELKEAKGYLEGRYILDNEDTHNSADELGYWALMGDASLSDKYLKKIRSVTRKDIYRVVKKYLGKNYAVASIEQE